MARQLTLPPYVAFCLRRVGQGIVVLVVSYLALFFVLFWIPGNPIQAMLADPDATYTPQQVNELLAYYGLNRPVLDQFGVSVWHLLHGNLGISLAKVEPVNTMIAQALPSTLQLAAYTAVIVVIIAVVVSTVAATTRWRPVRLVALTIPALSLSVPSFVLALTVLQVFSYELGWFNTLTATGLSATLPAAIVLAIPVSAPFTRVLSESAIDVEREPFVTFARSKGLSQTRILLAHVLRPSAMPGVTMLGLAVSELIAGSVIVESVFSRNGLGSVIDAAVTSKDSPVILAVVLLAVAVIIVINLGIDLLYPLLDPRLRVHAAEATP
jgi:peptide/nickel transport system permease protein